VIIKQFRIITGIDKPFYNSRTLLNYIEDCYYHHNTGLIAYGKPQMNTTDFNWKLIG